MSCCCKKNEYDLQVVSSHLPLSGKDVDKKNNENQPFADKLCLAVLILMIIGMISLIPIALYFGDIGRIFNNYDCFGNVCDRAVNRKWINHSLSGISTLGKPLIFQTDSKYWLWSTALCVKECPNKKIENARDAKTYMAQSNNSLCRYDIQDYTSVNSGAYKEFISRDCALLPVTMETPISGYCVVAFDKINAHASWLRRNAISAINRLLPVWQGVLRDLWAPRWILISLCGLSFFLSLLFLLILRFFPGGVRHIVLIFTVVATIILCGLIWFAFHSQRTDSLDKDSRELGILKIEYLNEIFLFYGSVCVSVITLFLLVSIAGAMANLSAVSVLLRECAVVLDRVPSLYFSPFVTFLSLTIVFGVWLFTLCAVSTIDNVTTLPLTGCVQFESHWVVPFLWVFLGICLVWITEFIIGCQQFLTCALVTEWYFANGQISSFSVYLRWIGRMICSHLGSVAMCSAIAWLFRLPRLISMLITVFTSCCAKKSTKTINEDTIVTRRSTLDEKPPPQGFCADCRALCSMTNRSAFVLCATESLGYCKATTTAHHIITKKSAEKVLSLNGVFNFLFLLARVTITFIILTAGGLILMNRADVLCYTLPAILVSIVAFLLAYCVMSVYETMVDVLLLCRSLEAYHENCNENVENQNHWDFRVGLTATIQRSCYRLTNQHKIKRKEELNEKIDKVNVNIELRDTPTTSQPAHHHSHPASAQPLLSSA